MDRLQRLEPYASVHLFGFEHEVDLPYGLRAVGEPFPLEALGTEGVVLRWRYVVHTQRPILLWRPIDTTYLGQHVELYSAHGTVSHRVRRFVATFHIMESLGRFNRQLVLKPRDVIGIGAELTQDSRLLLPRYGVQNLQDAVRDEDVCWYRIAS